MTENIIGPLLVKCLLLIKEMMYTEQLVVSGLSKSRSDIIAVTVVIT